MSWDEYRGDLDRFLALVQAEEAGVPRFLYGHSLGGLIVLEYAAHHPEGLAGVVALAPGLRWNLPPIQLWLGRVLARVRPTLSWEQPADLEDPLIHGRSSARLLAEMQYAMARTNAAAPAIQIPLLILHGTADPLIAPEVSRAFYERTGSPDKTLREYAGAGHYPHNEAGVESFMRDVIDWLDGQLAKQATP